MGVKFQNDNLRFAYDNSTLLPNLILALDQAKSNGSSGISEERNVKQTIEHIREYFINYEINQLRGRNLHL